jgi:hypothetical protein
MSVVPPRRRSGWIVFPPAVVLAIGVLCASPLPRAEARPEFARKEGKDCAFCHTNPRGGGPRTPKGEEYEKNGHKFAAPGFGEDDAFTTQANGQLFFLVKGAIGIEHFKYALEKLKVLQGKEKKGPGAQKVMNTWGVIDGRGRDLAKKAKDAITAGNVKDASEAMIRLEVEFVGREPAKEVGKIRTDLQKLPGGKEAETAAKALEIQRLAWFGAQMLEEEDKHADAVKALTDFVSKFPDGPFTADAKKKLEEIQAAPPPSGMGG